MSAVKPLGEIPADRQRRERHRSAHDRWRDLAWVFIASPILILIFGGGRYSLAEAAVMPAIGLLMMLWLRRRPRVPEHVASVEFVRPDDDGQDPKLAAFYLAWCDCGWHGEDQAHERAARDEARAHTAHVRPGLHAFFDE